MNGFESLSADELERYRRQILLPEIGTAGQLKLKQARVLIAGIGGLGTPVALYLTAAGVGTLGLVERDAVELSNLHRQVLYRERDIGLSKLETAARELRALNSDSRLSLHSLRLSASEAPALIAEYDLVIDGTDNFAARYLLNDTCLLAKKPLVYGSVGRFRGMISTLLPGEGPCFRCLHPIAPPPEETPSCNEGGVLGVVPGTIALLQATEALKLLLGIGSSLSGRVLYYDALDLRFRELKLERDSDCPSCGDHPRLRGIRDLEPEEETCAAGDEIAPADLLKGGPWIIVDVREAAERALGAIAGSLHIPLKDLRERNRELNADRAIVVYCKSGQRSARACAILRALGYENVRSLRGGFDAFQASH